MRSFKALVLLSFQLILPCVSLASTDETDPLKILPPEIVEKVVDYAGPGIAPLSGVNKSWNGYLKPGFAEQYSSLIPAIQSEIVQLEKEEVGDVLFWDLDDVDFNSGFVREGDSIPKRLNAILNTLLQKMGDGQKTRGLDRVLYYKVIGLKIRLHKAYFRLLEKRYMGIYQYRSDEQKLFRYRNLEWLINDPHFDLSECKTLIDRVMEEGSGRYAKNLENLASLKGISESCQGAILSFINADHMLEEDAAVLGALLKGARSDAFKNEVNAKIEPLPEDMKLLVLLHSRSLDTPRSDLSSILDQILALTESDDSAVKIFLAKRMLEFESLEETDLRRISQYLKSIHLEGAIRFQLGQMYYYQKRQVLRLLVKKTEDYFQFQQELMNELLESGTVSEIILFLNDPKTDPSLKSQILKSISTDFRWKRSMKYIAKRVSQDVLSEVGMDLSLTERERYWEAHPESLLTYLDDKHRVSQKDYSKAWERTMKLDKDKLLDLYRQLVEVRAGKVGKCQLKLLNELIQKDLWTKEYLVK